MLHYFIRTPRTIKGQDALNWGVPGYLEWGGLQYSIATSYFVQNLNSLLAPFSAIQKAFFEEGEGCSALTCSSQGIML